jgi:hypothetical protein
MASKSGSSEMSIRKFDGTNFNFRKEQMQDYLIVHGVKYGHLMAVFTLSISGRAIFVICQNG